MKYFRGASLIKIFSDSFIVKFVFFNLFLIMIFLFLFIKNATPYFYLSVILFFSGWILWTLLEYWLNKSILHFFKNKNSLFYPIIRYHELHHQHPCSLNYMAVHPFLVVGIFSLILLIGFLSVNWFIFPFLAGMLMGNLFFVLIHWAQHHFAIAPDHFLYKAWKRHFLHHYKYPDKAFGVSTGIWDWLFRSRPHEHLFFKIDPFVLERKEVISFEIIEVKDGKTENAFYDMPKFIYSKDPYWIAPLHSEEKNTFDSSHNSCFQYGVARRWILVNDKFEIVGRIAAFIDFRKMYEAQIKIGSIGFFECINDYVAASCLFEAACDWLRDNYQINAVEGPVNFGENDKFWGLLIQGFNYPSYGMNYNPPYYRDFFERFGFEKQYEQLTNVVDFQKGLSERFINIASRVCRNNKYSFQHFSYKHQSKFIGDFIKIYNSAWASFKGFKKLNEEYIEKSFQQIKPVVEESFIWFAYSDNEPIGLLVAIPDINEILRYFKGKLGLLDKIRFLMYKNLRGFTKVRVIIMGIVPEFQRMGIESGLIYNAYLAGKKKPGYRFVQLAWVGDFNSKMIAIHEAMGAIPETKHATYRKYF